MTLNHIVFGISFGKLKNFKKNYKQEENRKILPLHKNQSQQQLFIVTQTKYFNSKAMQLFSIGLHKKLT